MKLQYDGPLSNFAFNFNLRHYKVEVVGRLIRAGADANKACTRLGGAG